MISKIDLILTSFNSIKRAFELNDNKQAVLNYGVLNLIITQYISINYHNNANFSIQKMCGGEGEVLKKGGESRIGRAKLEASTVYGKFV